MCPGYRNMYSESLLKMIHTLYEHTFPSQLLDLQL